MSSRATATLIGAAGVVLWASETALITFTVNVPPLQTVALAFAAAALLAPIVWAVTGTRPSAVKRIPLKAAALTVAALVGYHGCIYFAVQKAPAAPAALLQGATPLIIILGSAFLPGERLRWWHITGALLGFAGVFSLVFTSPEALGVTAQATGYLALVALAAGLWGAYSLVARTLADVPCSVLGVFYAISAVVAGLGHAVFETWVTPSAEEWLAIAALGVFPMGLALYFWDHGVKRGDIQALGGFSYVEPALGALLVAMIGRGDLTWSLACAGALVMAGAAMAGRALWPSPAATASIKAKLASPVQAARAVRAAFVIAGARMLVLGWRAFARLRRPIAPG